MKPMLTGTTQLEIQSQLRKLYNEIKKVTHIPSLRLDDFNQTELLNYLQPLQKQAEKVSFGVGSYIHGATILGSYTGSVYSPTQNRIYFVPNSQSDEAEWHYLDCNTGAVEEYANGIVPACQNNAYAGGVYSPTQNRIYFVPFSQAPEDEWHYVDCDNGTVHAYTHGVTVAASYIGGVYSPTQNRIYFVPNAQASEEQWHYIDCDNGIVHAYTHGVIAVTYAYIGGVYSPTQNRIYFVPCSQSIEDYWHYIDCDTGEVIAYLNKLSSPGSYYGASYSPTQNRIYFVPYSQAYEATWHYIQEYSDIPVSRNLMAGPLFNKL